jgi:hypothetical protein
MSHVIRAISQLCRIDFQSVRSGWKPNLQQNRTRAFVPQTTAFQYRSKPGCSQPEEQAIANINKTSYADNEPTMETKEAIGVPHALRSTSERAAQPEIQVVTMHYPELMPLPFF